MGDRGTVASTSSRKRSIAGLNLSKEINIRVKLDCLVQIDPSTNNYIDKMLTNVHCELAKVVDQSSRDKARDDESSRRETAIIRDGNYEKEWKNINLLTSTLIKFVTSKLDYIFRNGSKEEKSFERIHFSTPQVEQKWRKIVDEEKYKKRKLYENKEEPQLIAILGPIPTAAASGSMFRDMCFVVPEPFSIASIDPEQLKVMQSNSEVKYIEEWTRRPFVRDRLVAQITAAGGTFYDRVQLVPRDKYPVTKLITNIPNTSSDSLFCLSVGIEAYSHQWIIRSCQENKIVNPAEERLPAGWSLTRECYVEVYQRASQKALESNVPLIVVIPIVAPKNSFHSFWQKIIRNSGGSVLFLDEEHEERLIEASVVLIDSGTPRWAIRKATFYDIPLVTARWLVQCLIEGQICDYDAHPSFHS